MKMIGLFSVPRSGSSWLGEIMNSSPNVLYKFQPNFAYTFEYNLSEDSTTAEIDDFFYKLNDSNDDFVNGNLTISGKERKHNFYKEDQTILLFKETHYLNVISNLLQKSDTKIIGLVRSPFAVINSWINIPKEFHPDWNIKEEWMRAPKKNNERKTHFFGYNKWKEVCFLFLDFQKKHPNQFYLINYDDLLKSTEIEVKKLFEFCGLDYTEQTRNFLQVSTSSQSKDAYAVFKQKKDDLDWHGKLPKFIEEEIKNDEQYVQLNRIFQWI